MDGVVGETPSRRMGNDENPSPGPRGYSKETHGNIPC